MATLYSSQITNDRAAPPVRGEFNRNGSALRCRIGTYVFSGSEAAGDVVQMVNVPKGAIVDIALSYIKWEDMGGTITVDVGDGDDDDRYCSALAMGTASTSSTTTFEESVGAGVYKAEYEYTAADTIDLTLDAATTPTADQTLKMFVFYTMNG
jgi:hypothetical protein